VQLHLRVADSYVVGETGGDDDHGQCGLIVERLTSGRGVGGDDLVIRSLDTADVTHGVDELCGGWGVVLVGDHDRVGRTDRDDEGVEEDEHQRDDHADHHEEGLTEESRPVLDDDRADGGPGLAHVRPPDPARWCPSTRGTRRSGPAGAPR